MKIYLAVPYSGMKEESFRKVNTVAAKLMNDGHIVYSPISHCHSIAKQEKLPTDWNFWKTMDTAFIEWCEELHVLKLNGWDRSTGVNAEIDIAEHMGKNVVYLEERDYIK